MKEEDDLQFVQIMEVEFQTDKSSISHCNYIYSLGLLPPRIETQPAFQQVQGIKLLRAGLSQCHHD
jgi:hypothetical protein